MKKETKPPKKITLQLDTKREKAFEEAWGIERLATVVKKAVGVLNPNGGPSSINASWLAKMALRAVAEGVVRDGCLPIPVRVDLGFAGSEDGYKNKDYDSAESGAPQASVKQSDAEGVTQPLEIHVPEVFLRLAEFYQLDPDRLVGALVWTFCTNPPRDLTLIAHAKWSDGHYEEPPPESQSHRG